MAGRPRNSKGQYTKLLQPTGGGGFTVSFQSNLRADAAVDEWTRAAADALYAEAEAVMADSKENYVPVDTGALRSSGFVSQPRIESGSVTVDMGFNTPYAIQVHEDLTAYHPHGEAKYLSKPLLKAAKGLMVRIAKRMLRVK